MAAGIKKRFILFILFLLIAKVNGLSQQNYLSRKVNVDCRQCSLDLALREVGKAGNFRLSYDAGAFAGDKKVSLTAENKEAGVVIRQLIGNDVKLREIGNHVIIIKSRAQNKKERKPEIIYGTIRNEADKKPLADVSVYSAADRRSSVSSEDGIYRIEITGELRNTSLSFWKRGYSDTVIFTGSQKQDIFLRPLKFSRFEPLVAEFPVNQTDSVRLVGWLVPRETIINSRNIEDKTTRTFQLSLIPYIGTNWKVTGSVTNRFSLNLLAGYTGGLRGLEIGGLINITARKMEGVQVGGLGNIVGGSSSGLQVAGLFNFDLGKFSGVQLSGLINYAPDTISGVQISGITNIVSGQINGLQISGLANVVTGNCNSFQIAGLTNISIKDARKAQISGLFSYGHNSDVLQLSGLVNVSSMYTTGVQISALLNYTKYLRGVQIGLINISQRVEKGVPVGLFSYVSDGYHSFEFSANEIFYGNFAFRSGTRAFYNFFQAGIGSDWKLQGSYGIGTIFSLGKKLSLNVDASAGFVYHPVDTVYHGLLLKAAPSLEYKLANRFAIFAGPAYNFFLFPKGDPSATPRGLSGYDFYFRSTQNTSIQMWIGFTAGIRL